MELTLDEIEEMVERRLAQALEGSNQNPWPPVLYTIDQAAEVLHLKRGSIYNLVKAGELKLIKIGRSSRITQEELTRLINERSAA